ncbi:beta strand repeat-containing protein, partial [Bathymodiolus thermophilus thioautotrophic gill symbiont]|uniref:beta strand repeat-containing protein n=1 Tax=Bathymodiolus thermophilus thioautotrophic gill symbiont TaxID=2360 RepID=UPI0015D612BB
ETDATQTLIITLTDINDESPTAITFTGDLSIAENTAIGAELGTFSATDADTGDTFTYTSSNAAFTFDNNKLKLNATLDYENTINLTTTITVTDANNHAFNTDFTFTITDTNDITPSNIQLSNIVIADGTTAGTTIATLSATDADTVGTLTYTLGSTDATSFTISGNQLKIAHTVAYSTKSSYNITITAFDGTNTSAPMNFSFSVNANFAITSSAAATVIENTSKTITLTANRNDATFTITGGADKAKFTLSGTTLTFAATDFEARTNDNTYEVVITARKTDETDATQTLIITLTDINDETPTAITFTGDLSIAENTAIGAELGTFSATDADIGDTFTYTSSNAAFTFDNNKLKLNATLDYENTINLTTTITVTDANNHAFNTDFTFTITDTNDITPSNIQLSNIVIADGTTAGTTIATLSATDADTVGTLTYTLGSTDATSFTISGNQLKIAHTVAYSTKSSYNITITAFDGVNTSAPVNFNFSVNVDFAITSPATITTIEKADKIITLAANRDNVTFAITDGADKAKFTLDGTQLTFTATDFEDGAENTYEVEITARKTGETDATQTLTLTLEKIVEITLANQSRSVNENSAIDTNIGTPLTTIGTISTFEITAGNDDGFFKINNTGQIQVAKNTLNHEDKSSHILTVKITSTNAIDKTAQITIIITDIDDTPPTNIVLSKSTITSNALADTIIGTLSATDTDTTSNLIYNIIGTNDNFEIIGNKLKLKTAASNITFPIT